MSILTKRNEFIVKILSYIIKSYDYNRNPLLLIENSAILFGKFEFEMYDIPDRGFEYIDENGKIKRDRIRLAFHYSQLHYFLRHLSKFGLTFFKEMISHKYYSDMYIDLAILHDPSIIMPFTDNGLFSKFLLTERYMELGQMTIQFNIMIIYDKYDFSDIPKNLLSETIYGEYIQELDIYSFNRVSTQTQSRYTELCLDWVVETCRLYNSSEKLEIWDGSFIDVEDSIKMVLKNQDLLMIKPLKIKEEDVTDTNQKCTICLDTISDKTFRTSCNHYFHPHCIASFLTKYYKDLYRSCNEDRKLVVEYDINGNVIQGANYEFSCPNCKNECFKLDCVKQSDRVFIKNPENCIFIDGNSKCS